MTDPVAAPAALPSDRAPVLRRLAFAVACATVGGGLATWVFDGPAWPAVAGGVLSCILGEIHRRRVNAVADREFYERYPELWRGWPPNATPAAVRAHKPQ